MRAVGRKDTAPELLVRSVLHRLGLRFRVHGKTLPGTPDIVLKKHRAVVFVHGCFWHRHKGCRRATTPVVRAEFWGNKFAGNVARDARVSSALRKMGWRVVVIWECQTKPHSKLERRVARTFSLSTN